MSISVKIKMEKGAEDLFPQKAHASDAAWDLRSRIDAELPVKKSFLVPTGVFIELPEGFEAQVRPRSGLALKHDLMLTNSPGTIDAGYRGEVGVIMYNGGTSPYIIRRGDRIAQMLICKLPDVKLELCSELASSDRGEGGFGSSGKH
ncbi:MAG: dUTP diphosphatase [Lentisphaeria bacterium]|nr:dUTP diphosphatase [Lentisphaeria bacterium]